MTPQPPPIEDTEDDAEEVMDSAHEQGGQLEQSFKCGQCGAKLEFKPGTDAQICPYCDHENPIPKSEEDIKELDFEQYFNQVVNSEETQDRMTVKCDSCGSESTSDPNVTSTECPFCGTNIVSTAKSSKVIKPKSLLPFKIVRREAREAFQKWVKSRWFAPSSLKKMSRMDGRFNGMYVPYWTYDCDTTTYYTGQRGEHYWVTQHYTARVNGKSVRRTRRVRKTRWWPASGTVWNTFDDILVLASRSLPEKYARKLEPWDLPNLEPYADEYLSGFRAESYQVDLPEGFAEAETIMDSAIRVTIRRDIGGDEQRIHTVRTQHNNITFKHILLPVWINAYRYKKKVFRLLVNARTGEVQGERPWSFWKIFSAVVSVGAIVGAIAYAIYLNQ